jgi:hypothetical protein
MPSRAPDQVFRIYNGLTLRVFDPRGAERAPTVQLIDSAGNVRWTIFATAETMDETRVSKLRFYASRTWPFSRARVVGRVEWSYGWEWMWWFIAKDGRLDEYWYSW